MARFEDLTLDELDVLRSVLSGDDKQVDSDMRIFLFGQVKEQFDAKQENERLRSEAKDDKDT